MPNALKHSQKNDMFPMFIAMAITIPLGTFSSITDPQIIRRTISNNSFTFNWDAFLWMSLNENWLKNNDCQWISWGVSSRYSWNGWTTHVTILLARGDSPDISRLIFYC